MEKQQIEKMLREYKVKKSRVDAANASIEAYEKVIENPEIVDSWSYNIDNREPGMPSAHRMSSVVEVEVCAQELTIDTIKEWIEDTKARIFKTALEVKRIEIALQGLTYQEKFLIELKYFEKLNWKNIEINFNQKFRQQNCITDSGLQKINTIALDKLSIVLDPFNDYISR